MKLVFKYSILILLIASFSFFKGEENLYAANTKRDCEGFRHQDREDEYLTCKRLNGEVRVDGSVDCVNCGPNQTSGMEDLAQAVAVVAQPVAYFLQNAIVSRAQNRIQEKWANTYAEGYKQCTARFNTYLNNNIATGANPILANQIGDFMSCNSNPLSSYAGFGGVTGNGYGGYGNPFLANGFSPGFMNGFTGPFGNSSASIYGSGMMAGSMGASAYAGASASLGGSVMF